MQFAGNAVNLVSLDACRNDPLAKANRSGTHGLARLDAPRGSFVGYSTAPGDVAADGDGANSPYALALAGELKKPGISVEEAHRNVRARVLAATGEKQTPWDSSSLTGAVVLAARVEEPAAQPAPAQRQQASIDKEMVFWESIKGSADPADFEAYLTQYPQGTFVPLAKNKIAAPKVSATPAPAPQSAATEQEGANASNAAPPSKQIVVPAEIQDEIADYLANAGSDRFWALAITRDGTHLERSGCAKVGYSGKAAGCLRGANVATQENTDRIAIERCGGLSSCLLLYQGVRKVANVELITQ